MQSKACLPELPIAAVEDEIRNLLANNQVLVVAGATGSGKTTQLPKICLAVGRKRVVHTQPRRIAARAVAERLAAELGTTLGDTVGFQIRFAKKTGKMTKVKVVTDGVLLTEIANDPLLQHYDTVIVDEAHERSMNIDFLLGFLKQLLPKRPDLRVIVTSATIDTERFSRHFDGAPIVEIEGRAYPVEVRYRPLTDDREPTAGLREAVLELWPTLTGDILVFLSGEREIREAADMLIGLKLPHTEIVPLFARLSLAEQRRVFNPHSGTRIVLATNVAETSVTVPGVRAVIDFGMARISRYSPRMKVQRLPIEPISQAAAEQRSGRCGRLGPGICIRLYSEDDFVARELYTDPEILRTNLASIILQMAWAGLGDIEAFPFIEAPNSANVRDGIRLLRELGALREDGRLTKIGRQMARLPIDPVLARMLVEADRLGCLREVQAVVAGLSIMDVRERPTGLTDEADISHRRFWSSFQDLPGDDISAILQLWRYLRDNFKSLSGSAFRRMCRDEFFSFVRVREWQELTGQIKDICRDLGLKLNQEPGRIDEIRTCVLSGLLSHIGAKDLRSGIRGARREFQGARGIRFSISPGSVLSSNPPDLVAVVELVETTRLWGRVCMAITPQQVEAVGDHLLTRSYYEPHWSASGGQAVARERVLLLGVPIIADRLVSLSRIDPPLAREMFIRNALVAGEWHGRHDFWQRNQRAVKKVRELEDRARQDLLISELDFFDFFAAKIPEEVVSVAHFDRWWRSVRESNPKLLDLNPDDLMLESDISDCDFPDVWKVGVHDLPITYAFSPGSGADGVSVDVPLTIINRISPNALTWQVPGLRFELAVELMKALPKANRVQLVPLPDTAKTALEWLANSRIDPQTTPFWLALGRAVEATKSAQIPDSAWDVAKVPGHLRLTVTSGGKSGEDISVLANELRKDVSSSLRNQHAQYLRDPEREWLFDEILPETSTEPVAFPALADEGKAVSVTVFASRTLADRSHNRGVRRLLALNCPDTTMWVVSRLDNATKLVLGANPYSSVPELLADARLAAIEQAVSGVGAVSAKIRTASGFANLLERVRPLLAEGHMAKVRLAADILRMAGQSRLAVGRIKGLPVADDLLRQIDDLVFPGFLGATPPKRLPYLPRYLEAISIRVAGIEINPRRDESLDEEFREIEDSYDDICAQFPVGELPDDLLETGWLLEELRVSLFAQRLGTKERISTKRLRAKLGL